MSQTRVIDLSAINKNLSIRFRSKFRKQSKGSISNYLRAISLARTFPNYLRAASIIATVIAKKVKGEGLIHFEEYITVTTFIISGGGFVIRKCGLCYNFDQSCDHMGGGLVISQAEIECHHIGRAPFITSMGGHRRSW